MSHAAAGAGRLYPKARSCRCAIAPSNRLLEGLAVTVTQSAYPGPNDGAFRCDTEPLSRNWYGVEIAWSQCLNLSLRYETLL